MDKTHMICDLCDECEQNQYRFNTELCQNCKRNEQFNSYEVNASCELLEMSDDDFCNLVQKTDINNPISKERLVSVLRSINNCIECKSFKEFNTHLSFKLLEHLANKPELLSIYFEEGYGINPNFILLVLLCRDLCNKQLHNSIKYILTHGEFHKKIISNISLINRKRLENIHPDMIYILNDILH